MIVWRDPSEVTSVDGARGRAVAIGAFDGVHLGHQAVLRLVRDLAAARGLKSTVLTFDRHPAEVVRPGSAPKLLTTLDQKLELLEATGAVDECLVLAFDDARSKEPAEDFVAELLAAVLGARLVVVGADFHFGYRRHGDVALLQRMGAELGFEVLGLGLVASPESEDAPDGGVPYSSTRARMLLARGEVELAASILGRPHEVRGRVERGDDRGRELGFPTANVAVPEQLCLPADGVYVGTYTGRDGVERPAAISLGRRPTFYAESRMLLLEAHLLDFEGDLYEHDARVRFLHRLRGQERFDSVEALIEQMAQDVAAAREWFRAGKGLW
ncbi:MAG TPA: bifunctional riboflavin kinase/FAD synthetase [Acidimicrobiia bacterium]|nr:bifunctional riboflavin kinase/FAD synthetase [Acidimicrobiia bacterium]